MTALDIFVILLLGGSAMVGFVRGFAHEVLACSPGWLRSALKFNSPLASARRSVGSETGAAQWRSPCCSCRLIAVKCSLARGGQSAALRSGPIDRVLGGGFGMVKGLIGATFLLLAISHDMVTAHSRTTRWIPAAAPIHCSCDVEAVSTVETRTGRRERETT